LNSDKKRRKRERKQFCEKRKRGKRSNIEDTGSCCVKGGRGGSKQSVNGMRWLSMNVAGEGEKNKESRRERKVSYIPIGKTHRGDKQGTLEHQRILTAGESL